MSCKTCGCLESLSAATIFLAATFFVSSVEAANEVAEVCKTAGVPIVELSGRVRTRNLQAIGSQKLHSSGLSGALKKMYIGELPRGEVELISLVDSLNERHIPDSRLKEMSLKYSTKEKRKSDLASYRTDVIEQFNQSVPKEFNQLSWYLSLKDPVLAENVFRPNNDSSLHVVYGAEATLEELAKSKFKQEVVFSIEASEPIPYLIPLIAHELHHAYVYKDRIRLFHDEKALAEYMIVEEAIANDLQMRVYLELAKKDPKTFCNWMYVSWSFGELPVPLSWKMASMEADMARGTFMVDYAKSGYYKDKPFLLNKEQTALRDDLAKRISSLKLKFIK